MPDLQPQSDADTTRGVPPVDPLAGLYHMSNTAGVSTQEYVAINPTAIAALILGFASVLVVLSNILLVIPIVGIICGIIAIVQIRHSNQTQTGKGLAILGLLLSFGLGVGKTAYEGVAAVRITADERQIAQLIHQFGQDITSKNYAQAYSRFSESFKERVPLATFEQITKSLDEIPGLGGLRSAEWNQHHMLIEEKPDASANYANAMALFQYANNPQPRRSVMTFEKTGGVWRVHDIESLFPTKKQR